MVTEGVRELRVDADGGGWRLVGPGAAVFGLVSEYAAALAADAEKRGWGEEAARHRHLAERLGTLISRAQSA